MVFGSYICNLLQQDLEQLAAMLNSETRWTNRISAKQASKALRHHWRPGTCPSQGCSNHANETNTRTQPKNIASESFTSINSGCPNCVIITLLSLLQNEPKMPQPTTLTTCLSQRQMAQQKAFGPTSIEGGSHAAEDWITLLVSLDVLLDQICLILLLGALSRQ